MSAKLEFSLTWNGHKFARFQLDSLPWWMSTIIATIPKATICVCVARNFDKETAEIKKMFKPDIPLEKM